jgi:hypothetical protein
LWKIYDADVGDIVITTLVTVVVTKSNKSYQSFMFMRPFTKKNVDSNGSYDCIHWFCCLGFLSMKRTRSSGVHLLDKWETSCSFLCQHLYFHGKKLNHSHTKKSLRTVLYVKLHMARRWVICLFKFVLQENHSDLNGPVCC